MFIEMRQNMSRSALRQRLKGALAVEAEDIEIEIDLLLDEVSRRNRIATDTYPFKECDDERTPVDDRSRETVDALKRARDAEAAGLDVFAELIERLT